MNRGTEKVKCPRCGKMHYIMRQPVFFGDQTICPNCVQTGKKEYTCEHNDEKTN